jgi:3-keto-5-aminohexanoate cleavage enzyme
MEKLIIEARVNEYAMRRKNPNVPWLPGEIARDAAECREAGASIVHFHGRGGNGEADNRYETCRDTILAIRQASSILVHPSLGYLTVSASFEDRFANMRKLSADHPTRPDIAPLDMGSVNADLYDARNSTFRNPGTVYVNSTDMLIEMAREFRKHGLKPSLVAWNVSFLRQIDAFARMSLIDEPLFVSLVMTDNILIAGHPGTADGLDAFLMFLPSDRRVVWAVTYIGGKLDGLLDKVLLAGGHIQVGLGDHPHADEGSPRNAELVAKICRRAKELGREIATPAEARVILQLPIIR